MTPTHAPASDSDFQTLFESAPEPYLMLAPDLRIVAASDAYLQATAMKRDEIVGKTLFDTRAADPFLSTLSHELRNPLHTIIGFSELLAEETGGRLSETQKGFVRHIHKDALRLLEMIGGITGRSESA